jgi:hypothetical protein
MISNKELAEHEASHALMAWLSGARIFDLSIAGPVSEQSIFAFLSSSLPVKTNIKETITSKLLTHLAPAGVEHLNNEKISYAALYDVGQFMEYFKLSVTDAEMAADAGRLLDEYDDKQQAALIFFKKYGGQVKAVLHTPQAKKALKALAAKLKKYKKLSGYETALCLEKSWPGPLPEKVLPAGEHPAGLLRESATAADALQAAKRFLNLAFEGCKKFDETERPAEILLRTIFELNDF